MIALLRLKKISWNYYLTNTCVWERLTALTDNIFAVYYIHYKWWRCFNREFRKQVNERLLWYKNKGAE